MEHQLHTKTTVGDDGFWPRWLLE